jgi:acyl-CoA thioester hydrolase
MTLDNVTYRGVVYPWHCDHMGHMNVMWYAGKFDEACWQLLAMLGLSPSRLRQEGAALAAVDSHIEYKRELHAGDVISIRTVISNLGQKSIRFHHEMRNDETGEIAASCTIVGVYMRADDHKTWPWPPDIRSATQAFSEEGEPADEVPWCAFKDGAPETEQTQ